jgi:ABC-type nitrate/sulfonate/bicarbonate transport system substrate-binding protein
LVDKQGVHLDPQPDSTSATAPTQALLAGQVDVALLSANVALAAIAAGQDLVTVGVFSPATGFQLVLSKDAVARLADSGVTPTSAADRKANALRGLTIATNGPGNNGDTLFRAGLAAYGVAEADVRITPIPDPNAMLASLREGKVDGFIYVPPFSQQPAVDGTGTVWLDYIAGEVPQLSGVPSGLVVTTTAYARSHSGQLKGLLAAIGKGFEAINDDPATVAAALAMSPSFAKTDPALFRASFEASRPIFARGPNPSQAGFDRMLQLYNATIGLKTKADVTFDRFFDPDYVTRAAG